MKLKLKHLIIGTILTGGYLTNPPMKEHSTQLLNGQSTLNYEPDAEFIHRCEYHDYLLFSFYAYKGKPVTFGIYNNVHVLYYNLSTSMNDHRAFSLQEFNISRGSPGF